MNNVQEYNSYVNKPSSQTYESYFCHLVIIFALKYYNEHLLTFCWTRQQNVWNVSTGHLVTSKPIFFSPMIIILDLETIMNWLLLLLLLLLL
jgi:hypothetical protein